MPAGSNAQQNLVWVGLKMRWGVETGRAKSWADAGLHQATAARAGVNHPAAYRLCETVVVHPVFHRFAWRNSAPRLRGSRHLSLPEAGSHSLRDLFHTETTPNHD